MYKDKEKQREANLKAQRKRRGLIPVPFPVIPDGEDKAVGVTFVIPEEVLDPDVTPILSYPGRYSYSKDWYK